MVSLSAFLLGALPLLAITSQAAKAPQVKDSPRNVLARAHLDKGKLKGVVEFSAKNGTVLVHIDTTGLPEDGGPFYYHIHKSPVAANGNCESTGTHLNPYNAPAEDCDAFNDDSYCQVGDLSGKHGFINTTCFEDYYYDPYLSLNSKNKANVIGLSVNIHFANMTRIACGTIEKTKDKVKREEGHFMLGNGTALADAPYLASNVSSSDSSAKVNGTVGTNGTMLQSTYCDSANLESVGFTGLFGAALAAIAALM